MKKILTVLVIVLLLAGVSGVVYAQTHTLYTTTGFVEMLIARGIVPQALAEKARSFASAISRVEDVQNSAEAPGAQNADNVEVSVSQLIEFSSLTFDAGSDVRGLLLVVKNPTTEVLTLEAKRGCQVQYKIYNRDDQELYDSSTTEACQTEEKVTWKLQPGQVRMFPVSHSALAYPLEPGTYRFELEYPGYGKGDRTVTIQ